MYDSCSEILCTHGNVEWSAGFHDPLWGLYRVLILRAAMFANTCIKVIIGGLETIILVNVLVFFRNIIITLNMVCCNRIKNVLIDLNSLNFNK